MEILTIALAVALAVAVFLLVRKPDAVGSLSAAVKLVEGAKPEIEEMGLNSRRASKIVNDINNLIEECN